MSPDRGGLRFVKRSLTISGHRTSLALEAAFWRKLEALAKRLDYGCINDVPPFDQINPSAENIAQWFARELGAEVTGEDAVVQAVTIWEGPVNSVTFRP